MAGSRHTYKQELITRITRMFKHSTIPPIPTACLRDMSTSSLAAFQEWMEPLIRQHPANGKKGEADE